MKPMHASELRGIWAAVLLPINENGTIDYTRLAEEIAILCRSGVDGIYTHGTSGEFYALTEAEFDRINALLAEECERAGVPFQIGASYMSAQVSLERVNRAATLRPGAIQVILPDWLPPSDDEAIAFLQQAADKANGIGLVLYNPAHAKRQLEPATFARFRRTVPQLIGIKTSVPDAEWYTAMQKAVPELAAFAPGHHLASAYRKGAVGSYSFVAALQPVGAKRWYELIKSDLDRALELEVTIQTFIATHITPFKTQHGYSNPSLDKLMAAVGGWANVGLQVRSPYRSIPETEAHRLKPIARLMLPELFPDE